MKTAKIHEYYFKEELANVISHGVGMVLAVAVLLALVVKAVMVAPEESRVAVVTGCAVFGASLVLVYLCSTLYHAFMHTTWRGVFQTIDQVAIFLLIAGSYTFFCLALLDGPVGRQMLWQVWALAGVGIFIHVFFQKRFAWVCLVLYLVMGWLALTQFPAIIAMTPTHVFALIVGGGVAYTVGCIFYSVKRKWMHFVWHLFVLAGSGLHVLAAFCLVWG